MQYKKDEVKNKLLAVAFDEFEKEGFRRASIRKISVVAKVPIGNLYRYFDGKEGLFEAIVLEASRKIPNLVMHNFAEKYAFAYENKQICGELAAELNGLYVMCGRELMLLMDKSEGSKFQSFGAALRSTIISMCLKGIYGEQEEGKEEIAEIVSDGFLSGLFRIFRTISAESRTEQLRKLVLFYFYGCKERIE